MKNYYCWCWKLGSEYPEWTGELVISGDFPAQSVCKKIRYCCFSHSTPVAADGRRWVHETPLFPPESAVSLCLFSVSLCFSLNRVIQWSSVSECTACTYGCLSAHIHIWMCVFQFFFFFFFLTGSTVVHMCVLRQCGALWFPAPWLLIFSFLSLFHSLPLPSSPISALLCWFSWRCLTKYPEACRLKMVF